MLGVRVFRPFDRGKKKGGKGVLALCLAGAAVLMAGCEFSCTLGGSIPAEELERQVRLSYEDETGTVIRSITCEESDPDTGSPISCRAVNEVGVELTIGGEVTSYNGVDEVADFDWQVTRAVAPGTVYADAATQTIQSQFGVTVDRVECPERIVVERGATIACTAIEPGGLRTAIVLTLTDRDGGFEVSVERPAGSRS